MILRTVSFQLQIDSKSKGKELKDETKYCYNFKLKTKHIFNYIERNCLKSLDFKTLKSSGIIVTFYSGYPKEKMTDCNQPYIAFNKNIAVDILFNKQKYDTLKTDNEFREFIYQYMIDAFSKIETKFQIPSSEILASYNELKENNFKNQYFFKRKRDIIRRLTAELHCEVTIDKFILYLKIIQNKEEIYNEIILETNPDEYSYAYKIKKLVIEDDFIKVLGTGDKVTFSLPIDNILNK